MFTWHYSHTADEEVPEHEFFKNYEGMSGSMEPKAVLDMYTWLFNQHVIVGRFIADDDSSIKAS